MTGRQHRALLRSERERYDEYLERQGGVCAICGRPPQTRRLHIDHDHRSMQVRGLLCHRCNRALPTWITPRWLIAAASYLGASRLELLEEVERLEGGDRQ